MSRAVRAAIVAAILTMTTAATAQTDLHDWNNVRNIPVGSDVWVKAPGGNVSGTFLSADNDGLRIEPWRHKTWFSRRVRSRTMARSDVRQIRFNHRAVSALAGTAIGVGLGVAAGAGLDAQYPDHAEEGHIAAALFGFFGGLFGELIGERTSFIRGETIYLAP